MSLDSAILNNITTAIAVLDAQLNISFTNNACSKLFGLNKKKIEGKNVFKFFPQFPINFDSQQLSNNFNKIIHISDISLHSFLNNITVELTINPFNSSQYLLEIRPQDFYRDLGKIENQTQFNISKEIIRGIAHEIKNPLAGLRGAAQLLRKKLNNSSNDEYIQMIIEQSDRLTSIVDKLLGPQKVETYEVINIHIIIEKVLQVLELDEQNNITFQRDYDPSLPNLKLQKEPIQQVFFNILSNACHASKNIGKVIIKTRILHQFIVQDIQYKLTIQIDVIDFGEGIPDEIKSTLFYPMVTRRDGGTGLGLSIANNIIIQHKGKIEAKSSHGITTFSIYLPIY